MDTQYFKKKPKILTEKIKIQNLQKMVLVKLYN